MTEEKTLRLALEALEPFITPNWAGAGVDKANEAYAAIKEALAKLQKRYFCSRCGKRLSKDINDVHSCTPPRDIHGEPVNPPLRTFDDYGNKIK